jgi:CRP-like cAMP-binding protein
MARISLKKLLAKQGLKTALTNTLKAAEMPIAIEDVDGKTLIGAPHEADATRFPIQFEGEILGWVIGGPPAMPIATLLSHLIGQEAESRALAAEILDLYREVNLLFNLSEKLSVTLEPRTIASLILEEAQRLITSVSALVFLKNAETASYEIAAAVGPQVETGSLLGGDRAFIANDLQEDARCPDLQGSCLFAPLSSSGAIALFHDHPGAYAAKDLKILNTIATQAAPAIENALLHERALREAKEREALLQEQIAELQQSPNEIQVLDRPLPLETFDLFPPFDFLTPDEREWLSARGRCILCPAGRAVFDLDEAEHDELYLLLRGYLIIGSDGESDSTYLEAPCYFGERAVFFGQKPMARFVAREPVDCFVLAGADIRALVKTNSTFSRGFANVFQHKHRIFAGFETFQNVLFAGMTSGALALNDLLDGYLALKSILHTHATDSVIDFDALDYVLPRLPDNVTTLSDLILTEELPAIYRDVQDVIRLPSQRSSKRGFYAIAPGKTLTVLRDSSSDSVDLVTKLCIYGVEMKKIRQRLAGLPTLASLARLAALGGTADEIRAMLASLPFDAEEIDHLRKFFKEDLLRRLYETVTQAGEMHLYFQKPGNRYAATSTDLWLNRIRQAMNDMLPAAAMATQLEVHIISSNTHSVINCLSGWIHNRFDRIMEDSAAAPSIPKLTDRLYDAYRHWNQSHAEEAQARKHWERGHGIRTIADMRSTGIEVTLINLNQLSGPVDPDLELPTFSHPTFIVNIDYAYGQPGRSAAAG